jgi:hypothetical protein
MCMKRWAGKRWAGKQSKWERIARKCALKGARNCTRKCAQKYEQTVWKIE